MKVRAKFRLQSRTSHADHTGETLKFSVQYDDTIPEDQRFHKYTPTGHIEMFVTNPLVLNDMKVGQFYYVDFTPMTLNDTVANIPE